MPSADATAFIVTPAQATSASSSMSPEQSDNPSPPVAGCSPARAMALPVSTLQVTPSPSRPAALSVIMAASGAVLYLAFRGAWSSRISSGVMACEYLRRDAHGRRQSGRSDDVNRGNRTFVAYVGAFHLVWIAWPCLLYPRLTAALGAATLTYAVVQLSVRILVWVVPVFAYLRFVDGVDPFEYLKLRRSRRPRRARGGRADGAECRGRPGPDLVRLT